jgi:hypothetical protein
MSLRSDDKPALAHCSNAREFGHCDERLAYEHRLRHVRGDGNDVKPQLPPKLESVVVQEVANPLGKRCSALPRAASVVPRRLVSWNHEQERQDVVREAAAD